MFEAFNIFLIALFIIVGFIYATFIFLVIYTAYILYRYFIKDKNDR